MPETESHWVKIGVIAGVASAIIAFATLWWEMGSHAPGPPSPGPGIPTAEQIANPGTVYTPSSLGFDDGVFQQVGLFSCNWREAGIVCFLIYKNSKADESPIDIQDVFTPSNTFLVDEAQVQHKLLSESWINGHYDYVQQIPMGRNQPTWFTITFEGGEPRPAQAIISINNKTVAGQIQ